MARILDKKVLNTLLKKAGHGDAVEPEPKVHKYRTQKVEVDGIKYDSKFEMMRHRALIECEKYGLIRDLEFQRRFPLIVNGFKIGDYIADFTYYKAGSETLMIEDAKGVKTDVYMLKRKIILAQYGIDIWESCNSGSKAKNPLLNAMYLRSVKDAFPEGFKSVNKQRIIKMEFDSNDGSAS